MKTLAAIACIGAVGLAACNRGPSPIRLGEDTDAFCKMTIVDERFGAELITDTGKAYKFDSVSCLAGFVLGGTVPESEIGSVWVTDFNAPHDLVPVSQAMFVLSDQLHTPMGGGLAAFRTTDAPSLLLVELDGRRLSWSDVLHHVADARERHVHNGINQ